MRDKMRLKRRTFDFIWLMLVTIVVDYGFCETDSYLIGIHRFRSENPKKSKWSKNMLNGDSCGGIFREKQVLIRSPHFPNNYPKNIDCEYIFYSPFVCVNEFHIQFLDFNLEPSLSCTKDRVHIGADEVLCGQVIGIMKYQATNGTLRIKFTTDQTIENKGFELLVTRLPCSTDDSLEPQRINESVSVLPLTVSPIIDSSQPVSIQSPSQPRQNNVLPIQPQFRNTNLTPNFDVESVTQSTILKPVCAKGQTQSNGLWPNSIPQSTFSPTVQTVPAVSTLPSCCINIFNQQKFYLISPGFPNVPRFSNDCLFHIERLHSDFCRLRIEFKYFLLGDWQQRQQKQQRQCTHSFVEIDGRRFCGCKTGYVHYTQWGPSPKSIRFSNMLQYPGIQGFILEITQEPCPYRLKSLPIQNYVPSNQPYLTHANDPRRCSPNYISWLNFNTNQELLAQSVCIRNFG